MSLLDIIHHPNEILRTTAKPVTRFGFELIRLSMDMLETMYVSSGIGLAAPQVGLPIRLVVIDISDGTDELVLVNPQIIQRSGELTIEEGCLSIPGETTRVLRSREVLIRYKDCIGQEKEKALEGLLAVIAQHEIDHLDGILMIDNQ